MRADSIVIWTIAVTASMAAGQPAADAHPLPACSLSVENARVVAGEPVWLRLDCRNPASEAATLDFLTGRGVGWRVSPPVGGLSCWSWPMTLSPDNSNLPAPVRISLAPGETVSARVLLTRWVRFQAPGSFNVALVDCTGSASAQDVGGAPLTNEVAFEVAPPDAARLKETCEELVRQALAKGTGAESARSLQAAEALSWIDLPLAVPYLERLLLADRPESALAARGLARVADQAATAALIRAYDRVSFFTRIAIRGELAEMKPTVKDPELGKRLKFILSSEALRELVPASSPKKEQQLRFEAGHSGCEVACVRGTPRGSPQVGAARCHAPNAARGEPGAAALQALNPALKDPELRRRLEFILSHKAVVPAEPN